MFIWKEIINYDSELKPLLFSHHVVSIFLLPLFTSEHTHLPAFTKQSKLESGKLGALLHQRTSSKGLKLALGRSVLTVPPQYKYMPAHPFLLLKYLSDHTHLNYFLHSSDKWRRGRRLITKENVLCLLHIRKHRQGLLLPRAFNRRSLCFPR